eukprot:1622191-Alexandrium_andersonii.AAC.1
MAFAQVAATMRRYSAAPIRALRHRLPKRACQRRCRDRATAPPPPKDGQGAGPWHRATCPGQTRGPRRS